MNKHPCHFNKIKPKKWLLIVDVMNDFEMSDFIEEDAYRISKEIEKNYGIKTYIKKRNSCYYNVLIKFKNTADENLFMLMASGICIEVLDADI